MLAGNFTQEGLDLKTRQFQHETVHATGEKKTVDLLFHRHGLVETTYSTDQQEQWINGNGERSLQTAKPSDIHFCHVGTFNCLNNRVVVSETSSTADSFSPSTV